MLWVFFLTGSPSHSHKSGSRYQRANGASRGGVWSGRLISWLPSNREIPSGGDTGSFVAEEMARFGMLEAAQRDEVFIPSKPLELGEISWSQNPLQ